VIVARPPLPRRSAALLLTGVIGIAMVGYLRGINEDMQHYIGPATAPPGPVPTAAVADSSAAMLSATYSEMRRMETGPTSKWEPKLEWHPAEYDYRRCITCHDPHSAAVQPNGEDKLRSLATRATRRAFNGAPPVIPHAVERTDDAACYACHGQGVRVGQRVANRMSHGLLINCLQCHAAPPPTVFAHLEVAVANTFMGLPAPTSGARAFPGAPPVIPHSTWMREQCLSCHGGEAGWPGLEVPHRWRTDCRQCHGVSAQLEQAAVADPLRREPAAEAS